MEHYNPPAARHSLCQGRIGLAKLLTLRPKDTVWKLRAIRINRGFLVLLRPNVNFAGQVTGSEVLKIISCLKGASDELNDFSVAEGNEAIIYSAGEFLGYQLAWSRHIGICSFKKVIEVWHYLKIEQ